MNTDPIADMLSRIRNAVAVRKNTVSVPHSKLKQTLAEVLRNTHFIDTVEVAEGVEGKQIVIRLNGEEENARITSIERMSTPGRRMYVRAHEIPTYKQGRGIVVVSTSRGVMTGDEAKKQRLGGELLCRVD